MKGKTFLIIVVVLAASYPIATGDYRLHVAGARKRRQGGRDGADGGAKVLTPLGGVENVVEKLE